MYARVRILLTVGACLSLTAPLPAGQGVAPGRAAAQAGLNRANAAAAASLGRTNSSTHGKVAGIPSRPAAKGSALGGAKTSARAKTRQGAAGLSRASAAIDRSVPMPGKKSNSGKPVASGREPSPGTVHAANSAQRTLDHRVEQAQHLREIAEKNGNERLNTSADRMQENAQRNFDRRTSTVEPASAVSTAAAGKRAKKTAAATADSGRAASAKKGLFAGRPFGVPAVKK